MLNIGKLSAGGECYYLDTVASGVEDYCTGSGEAAGYWVGSATPTLGLSGEVHANALRAVLVAADPMSGQRLTRAGHRRVPGFDMTFRAPKSVSVLYGLADPETAGVVRDAHDRAVVAALGYLEREAGWSRRGVDGVERVRVAGLAAGFRHRSSRAGDPLLHTHLVVANLGQAADDGCWRTLDARQLYRHAKTAGYLYQAQLRHELTVRLGVEWGPVRRGCADLAGIHQTVLRAFSQRRQQIVARLAERGESSAKAAQIATLDTRRAKDRHVDAKDLRAGWARRAAALGLTQEHVVGLVGRARGRGLDDTVVSSLLRELVGAGGLCAQASTFTGLDVLRACCERLPAGATVADVEALAATVLDPATGIAVRLVDPDRGREATRRGDGRVPTVADAARYSTRRCWPWSSERWSTLSADATLARAWPASQ
ncbi:MAG: relaxase domain-containing protein [Actinomycetota bacterium]|nr:relaxase domain-containing protein [Actinomycetota bacterium]